MKSFLRYDSEFITGVVRGIGRRIRTDKIPAAIAGKSSERPSGQHHGATFGKGGGDYRRLL